jgi:hypothetical protein
MYPKSHFKKKALLFLALLVLSFTGFAQAPNLLNYQGVARNAVGNPLPNQSMKLRLSIHDLLPSGAVVYSEIRQITTNLGGLFSAQIGSAGASSSTGTLGGVNWVVGNKFLQVELDPTSNNNYIDLGTVQLVSVPYAFGAGSAATVKTNANLTGVVTSVGNATSIANGAITSDMIGTLNKSKVGLDLVNNTSDASKPISTLTQSALDLKANATEVTASLNTLSVTVASNKTATDAAIESKENATNKSTTITLGTSDDLYPTQKAVKTYVDNQVASASIADAGVSVKGKIQLAGDLGGTADAPTVPGLLLKADAASLATVATSGSYNDLTNKPTVPAAYSLPNASASELGGVKVGTGLTITDGVLSASSSGVPYTGATQAVDLGAYDLKVNGLTIGRGNNGIDNNVVIGKDALSSTTTGFQGNYLTAVGFEALKNDTWGYYNTAFGSNTLSNNTTGLGNTAIGSNSLRLNTDANYNTAVGAEALRSNKGNDNTASGASALAKNTTGQYNSAFGRSALTKNTTGSNNTATGINALENNTTGSENTAHGAYALQLNTTGRQNSAFGHSALKSNTIGEYNTATGFGALSTNTTGAQNTATGWYSLGLNTTGGNNTAFGWAALYPNTTGANNTAVGEGALKNNSTGGDNSAFGEGTLANNTTGIYNSAFGRESLHNSNGNNNTAIGWRAGNANTTGTNNTAIGMQADFGANNLTNATAIGYQASVSASDKIRLGNGTVTVIEGAVNFTAASDSRIKKNILNSNYGLSTVLKLRPVEYNLISNDLRQVGFIAQEVQKLVPEVVTGKEGDLNKGEILGITYSSLVPVLTKAIQEQQKQIEELKALVNQLINKKN